MSRETKLTTVATLTHCPDLWFPDGTVVLQAEKTVFCLYSGLLMQASLVFQDIFGIPEASFQETYDGRPFVQMPDPVVDMIPFLKCIFNHSYMTDLRTPFEMETLLRILRLSTKYQADSIRSRCLAIISPWFPCTVEALDAMHVEQRKVAKEIYESDRPIRDRLDAALSLMAVDVFSETDNLHLIPFALLRILDLYSVEDIYDDNLKDVHGDIHKLTPGHKRSIILGIHRYSTYAKREVFGAIFSPTRKLEQCTGSRTCLRQRAILISMLETPHGFVNPTAYLSPNMFRFLKRELCSNCYSYLCNSYIVGRQRVMDTLPETFGYPPWEELLKHRGSGT